MGAAGSETARWRRRFPAALICVLALVAMAVTEGLPTAPAGLVVRTTIPSVNTAASAAANIGAGDEPAAAAPRAAGTAPRSASRTAEPADLARHVNPFVGTAPGGVDSGYSAGTGNTFPGAVVPFGMVQWSPDTLRAQPGGYHYPDNRIKGFSLTHLSGAGCPAFGDIPFLPVPAAVSAAPAADPERHVATFSHAREQATPGRYTVTLDSGVGVDLTVTPRSGTGRFTYPAGSPATMLVDVAGSATGTTDAEVGIGQNTISGWAESGRSPGS